MFARPNMVRDVRFGSKADISTAKLAGEKVATPLPAALVKSCPATGWLQLSSGFRIACVSSCQTRQTAQRLVD